MHADCCKHVTCMLEGARHQAYCHAACAASADTTVSLWRFDGDAAAGPGPTYSAREAASLEVSCQPLPPGLHAPFAVQTQLGDGAGAGTSGATTAPMSPVWRDADSGRHMQRVCGTLCTAEGRLTHHLMRGFPVPKGDTGTHRLWR